MNKNPCHNPALSEEARVLIEAVKKLDAAIGAASAVNPSSAQDLATAMLEVEDCLDDLHAEMETSVSDPILNKAQAIIDEAHEDDEEPEDEEPEEEEEEEEEE